MLNLPTTSALHRRQFQDLCTVHECLERATATMPRGFNPGRRLDDWDETIERAMQMVERAMDVMTETETV